MENGDGNVHAIRPSSLDGGAGLYTGRDRTVQQRGARARRAIGQEQEQKQDKQEKEEVVVVEEEGGEAAAEELLLVAAAVVVEAAAAEAVVHGGGGVSELGSAVHMTRRTSAV